MKSWPIGKTKFAKEIGLEGLIQGEQARTVCACGEEHWLNQGVWRWGKEKKNKTNTGAMGNQTTHQGFQPLFDLFFNIQRKWIWPLLPSSKVWLTNKWTDVTPYSCKEENISSFCPLLVSSPHPCACSGALWLPAEATQVPNLQATSQSFGGTEKCQKY